MARIHPLLKKQESSAKPLITLEYKVVGRDYDNDPGASYDLVYKDDLDEVELLEKVVPEGYYKCPDCGKIAGNKEDYDSPQCFHCGYGIKN